MWNTCLKRLESEISQAEIDLWIVPMEIDIQADVVMLYASNDIVLNHVNQNYFNLIKAAVKEVFGEQHNAKLTLMPTKGQQNKSTSGRQIAAKPIIKSNIDPRFIFETFIEGRSNAIALAAAIQAAQKNNQHFNPLFLYGSTGLGKTHLLHAIGNRVLQNNKDEVVCYLHSETYVNEMVSAIRNNDMDKFKLKYRSVTTLLIDDIQFFAGKERTQEEFFHTFNYLLDGQQQVIITCDKFPKEVNGLDPRLKSRLGSGLSVAIDPPDYETRVAILQEKAEASGLNIPDEVAFYIAKQINSNIRELEGALNTLYANAKFTKQMIDLPFTKQTLKNLFMVHHRIVSIENIQKITAQYYNIKLSELLGKSRKRSIVRPRQMAMYLSKDMTDKSYPEIGELFGGRDHTTVLHAYRKMEQILIDSPDINEDKQKIVNKLTE